MKEAGQSGIGDDSIVDIDELLDGDYLFWYFAGSVFFIREPLH